MVCYLRTHFNFQIASTTLFKILHLVHDSMG